jgi:hypothetical protein
MVKFVSKVKSKVTKALRPREIAIARKGGGGLSGSEIKSVLATLRAARSENRIPALTYEHAKGIFQHVDKSPFYVAPKTADLRRTAVQVRQVIRKAYGDRYIVFLSS